MLAIEARRIVHLRTEIQGLERDIAELEAEASELRAVAGHADDELYRELLARRQGFVFPEETRVLPLTPGGGDLR